jgi:hypothetical protein
MKWLQATQPMGGQASDKRQALNKLELEMTKYAGVA